MFRFILRTIKRTKIISFDEQVLEVYCNLLFLNLISSTVWNLVKVCKIPVYGAVHSINHYCHISISVQLKNN